jgi:hypothetical protein
VNGLDKDEADQDLRQAIINHAIAYEITDVDDELLSEYAVVAHWQKIEADGNSRYTTHYHTPTIPNHVAVGLFQVAKEHMLDED